MNCGQNKAALAACLLMAGAAGYCFQAVCDRPVAALTFKDPAGVDYFLTARSFSEVDNTRALMEALAAQSLQELRIRRICTHQGPKNTNVSPEIRDQRLAEVIRDLQETIAEFAGTGQQMLFVQELLGIYRREGRYQDWVNLFLEHAYRDPTNESIGRMSEEALVVARAARREVEILEALRHLRDIPLEFAAKRFVESTLASACEGPLLARTESGVGPARQGD
jgi:hypothetical protein